MAQGDAGEVRVGVCEGGDGAHAVGAVDVREEGEEGEVPVCVGQGGEVDCAEGDVVVAEGWGCGAGGEEFDV